MATQILESLAESGLRSRAEIADAIMGQRAECVMLNNGPHILEAIETLSRLLGKEERLRHQIKKLPIFRDFTDMMSLRDDILYFRLYTAGGLRLKPHYVS